MDNAEQITRYSFRTLYLGLGGALMALCTAPIALVAVWRVQRFVLHGDPVDFADLIVVLGLLVCGGLAAFGLGIAFRRPVGLRIDRNGISGFVAPNLSWDEVDQIEIVEIYRGSGIWLTLRDPEAFVERQTGWARVRYAKLGKVPKIFVNTAQLTGRTSDIAAQMVAMKTASA